MAAGAPVSDLYNWDPDCSNHSTGNAESTRSLEVGMSGMSLLTTLSDGGPRKGTSSTVSTSPDDNEHSSFRGAGSAPPSPSNDRTAANGSLKSHGRPPGLAGPLPSPIGKHGNSKNTSATSPSLTLTPNSSVDGHSDWNSVGKQASPYRTADPPSLPFLQPEHRRSQEGSYGTSSIDLGDPTTSSTSVGDGLMGLGALRERAHTSPGIMSSSPPIAHRGHLSPSSSSVAAAAGHLSLEQQQDRPRATTTRDRPPRSQPYEGYSSSQGDRSVGGGGIYTPSANRNDIDSTFGAIGRPELRQSATEFDPNRMRSSSADNGSFQQQQQQQQQAYGYQPTQPPEQKFGSLPTLGSHIQQQRGPESFSSLPKPRHVRSISQPVTTGYAHAVPHHGVDPRFYAGGMHSSSSSSSSNNTPGHTSRHSFSMTGAANYRETGNTVSRSASMTQAMLASSYDTSMAVRFKGSSVPNLGVYQQHQHPGYPILQRRDALDYQLSQGASPDEFRSYGGAMISPGQSPLQSHYTAHTRQPSDSGMAILSSSPLSMSSGIMRGGSMQQPHVRQPSHAEDDLAHPLVGESIEVPADHDDQAIHGGQYMVTGSHPLLRTAVPPTHVHSLSMDQLPPQFVEAPHHLPTAGAALPMPKVIYSVKFKRTQRNFVLGPRISRDLKIGTYVKVEADRGEDLGIVVGKTAADKFGGFSSRSSFTAGMGPPGGLGGTSPADLKRIIRLATHDEVSLLAMKRDEEEELLKICRGKVRQRGLPMNVVDAEYQFDRHKLTFFFEAEGRVDFRELVRDLFSMYKTRIWMQQLDKNTSTSAPAIIAPQAATLQMDFGTPIIAPVSEFADSLMLNGLGGTHHLE